MSRPTPMPLRHAILRRWHKGQSVPACRVWRRDFHRPPPGGIGSGANRSKAQSSTLPFRSLSTRPIASLLALWRDREIDVPSGETVARRVPTHDPPNLRNRTNFRAMLDEAKSRTLPLLRDKMHPAILVQP
jgi:hypothetical protein